MTRKRRASLCCSRLECHPPFSCCMIRGRRMSTSALSTFIYHFISVVTDKALPRCSVRNRKNTSSEAHLLFTLSYRVEKRCAEVRELPTPSQSSHISYLICFSTVHRALFTETFLPSLYSELQSREKVRGAGNLQPHSQSHLFQVSAPFTVHCSPRRSYLFCLLLALFPFPHNPNINHKAK